MQPRATHGAMYCAPTEGFIIDLGDELIIWDAAVHTEHLEKK